MSKRSNGESGCGTAVAILALGVAIIALIPAFGAWLYPQQPGVSTPTPTISPTAKPAISPTAKPAISPTAKPTMLPTTKPEPTISGEWEGTYTCSRFTGVTVHIDQTGDKVIADVTFQPPPEGSEIPRGIAKYEGPIRVAEYRGSFNSTSRIMRLSEGKLDEPEFLWKAFGFHGNFDDNFKTFYGKMDHYNCKSFSLKKKG
jgi:hypothetical protein